MSETETETEAPIPLFDPRHVSFCVRTGDGTIHTLRAEAPGVEPWTSCRAEVDEDARLILRLGKDQAVFAALDGFRIAAPKLCGECIPHADAERAKTLGERLKLFAGMAGEREFEELRRHLDAGTLPESREGRFGAIAVTLEALGKLRDWVDSGAYSREDYDAVVEELRNGAGSTDP